MSTLTALLGLLRSVLADRRRLLLENAALRQQLAAELHGKPVLGGLHHRYRAAG